MRAAAIARALPPLVTPRTPVGSALERMGEEAGSLILVPSGRGGAWIARRGELERAMRLGLREMPIVDLVLHAVTFVRADATRAVLGDSLSTSRSGVLVVEGEDGPIGVITRRELADRSESGTGRASSRFAAALAPCLSPGRLEALRRVGRAASGRAYLVGGGVRDGILGREMKDLDVAVIGNAAQIARQVGGAVVEHRTFGTATVTLENGTAIDLAGTRRESYSHPGALPRVEPASLAEDLDRRDFSVNAMALRLAPDGFGELHDPHGGLEDLESGTIRVLHGLSFIEDPTRAFRAVGLAARLGFAIDLRTSRLIRIAIREGVFDRLTAARLRREVERLLSDTHRTDAVRSMVAQRLLRAVDPGLKAAPGLYARMDRVESTVAWYRALRGVPGFSSWSIAFGVLLNGLAPERLPVLLDRIQPGRRIRRILVGALAEPPRLAATLRQPDLAASAIFEACREVPDEILLLTMVLAREHRVRASVGRYLEDLAGTALDMGGGDLIAAGVEPGPTLAIALAAALRAKLDGHAPTARDQLTVALGAAGLA